MSGEVEKRVEQGDQWEDVDSSEETFFLDPDGRVPFAGEVSFDFRSAPEALASSLSKPGVLDRVIADCQVVFSARAKKLAYSTGKTFWIQADVQPRNSLESLALAIFEAHTTNARFNRKTSGAEWWTQTGGGAVGGVFSRTHHVGCLPRRTKVSAEGKCDGKKQAN